LIDGLHLDVHEGEGPYALFVHGILSSRAQWMLNVEPLRAVCRPVVLELYGHGRSGAPADVGSYAPDGFAAAFETIRERLGADRWFVVGQSLGAALTMRYALDHPDRVIAQVFTNSASALADDKRQQRMAETAPAMARRIEEGGLDGLSALPIHPAQAKRLPYEVRRALLEDAESLDPVAVARFIQHTASAPSLRDRVHENRVPALLVAGTREESFAEPAAFAAANMPHLEVVKLDAGHAVNIQAAGGFNRAVAAFLSGR
jgi:2-succinyl-6-hydroxy-2,4-cyclohexadiene-1-carboxylate synthase